MILSKTKVEQIDNNHNVIMDYGESLSNSEIDNIIIECFPGVKKSNDGLYGRYDKTDFCLYFKNISYLGNPHPVYKKRIQIPGTFKDLFDKNAYRNIKTLLIGVYKYKNTILFCDFDTSTYVTKKMNNSSAHVYTIDLLKGVENGFFQKKDKFGNTITVFTKERVNDFYKYKFEHTEIECKIEIVNTFDAFFESISKEWFGISCYDEMIRNNYNNKFQSEWAGFYLEFLLDLYIRERHLYDIVKYVQNKKDDEIDLDLFFSKINSYGDLKTHSTSSNGVLGNDYETIENIVKDGKVYYIVCEHETNMDKDYCFEVTKFWNEKQNKTDLMSYSNKMKHDVKLKSYYILEINKFNFKYLDMYNQGKNSNGNIRKPKISISNKNIGNFLIHMVSFE